MQQLSPSVIYEAVQEAHREHAASLFVAPERRRGETTVIIEISANDTTLPALITTLSSHEFPETTRENGPVYIKVSKEMLLEEVSLDVRESGC